jgi:protein TonB
MRNFAMADQLDRTIEILIANPRLTGRGADQELDELARIAGELRIMRSPEFKAHLKADLMERAQTMLRAAARVALAPPKPENPTIFSRAGRERKPGSLPTLFGESYAGYPAQGRNFVASFLIQAAVIAVLVSSGLVLGYHPRLKPPVVSLILPRDYAGEARGGGGGGDADKLPAAKGNPPRFSSEQLVPPAVVVRNPDPKLSAEATVVGPPSLIFPQTPMGDPLPGVLAPSNGPGNGGGIGNGADGGVGGGHGPGVGPGEGGGFGDRIYRVGGSVGAPRAIYDPEPEYSDEARKAKHQGAAVLSVIVDSDGRTRDIRVVRSLGMGLDEKAVEAVRNWRFAPATKDGRPVAVLVHIEVDFRLY